MRFEVDEVRSEVDEVHRFGYSKSRLREMYKDKINLYYMMPNK